MNRASDEPSRSHVEPLTRFLFPRMDAFLSERRKEERQEKPFRVLHIAVGGGSEVSTILHRYGARECIDKEVEIHATDKSIEALEGVHRVISFYNANAYCHVRRMDGEQIDFPDNHFDAIVCFHGPMMFENHTKAFAEIERVLKPNGQGVTIMTTPHDSLIWRTLNEAHRRVRSTLTQTEDEAPHVDIFKRKLGTWADAEWPQEYLPKSFDVLCCEKTSHRSSLMPSDASALIDSIWSNKMMSFIFDGLSDKQIASFKQESVSILVKNLKENTANINSLWSTSILVVSALA